ncbi:MAG: glycosyltransferase [Synergistetes bacterium]|nr:glycosyltransferase [Synergistota bacterium]
MVKEKNVNPKVSVIIPTYNRSDLVVKAVDSVLSQTYGDFELIVVDDGSEDDTSDIVMRYNDERLIYIRYVRNRGPSAARNSGIRLSRGEYVAFLDSDDEWLPEKLERQIEVMEKSSPDVGVVYTGYLQMLGEESVVSPFLSVVEKVEGDLHAEIVRGDFILISSALVRKKCLEEVGGFDEYLMGPEVWDLWLRVTKKCLFKFINEPLVKRGIHGDNLSVGMRNPSVVKSQKEYIFRKYPGDFGDHVGYGWFHGRYKSVKEMVNDVIEKGVPVVVFGASAHGRGVLRDLRRMGVMCRFFVDNDREKWGKVIDGIEVKPPSSISKEDVVFVASSWSREIVKQLKNMGLEKFIIG